MNDALKIMKGDNTMKKLSKRTTMSLLIVALLCGLCLFAGAAYAQTKDGAWISDKASGPTAP